MSASRMGALGEPDPTLTPAQRADHHIRREEAPSGLDVRRYGMNAGI